MAQTDLQKSVQDIKDPEARKKAYYTKQREGAEKLADQGSAKGAGTASKIYGKLGNKEKSQDYGDQAVLGKTGAKIKQGIDKASEYAMLGPEAGALKSAGSLASKMIPEAESAVSSGAKALEGKLGQFLGRAKPAQKELSGKTFSTAGTAGKKAVSGAKGGQKALSGGKTGQKALTNRKLAQEYPPAKMAQKAELKGTGTAKSSPTKRDTTGFGTRLNPQTGKPVGKGGLEIASKLGARAEKQASTKASAEMNQAAAKQTPRSRAMRNAEIGGKRAGSAKKGSYKPAKLKARD